MTVGNIAGFLVGSAACIAWKGAMVVECREVGDEGKPTIEKYSRCADNSHHTFYNGLHTEIYRG